jgi:DNA-binding transcriptional LysR family regulator
VFLQEARQTLVQAEQAIVAARKAGRGELGRLVIGFVGSATADILPILIRGFHERYPEVELLLRELTTAQQVRALQDGRIHVGILRPPVHDDTLRVESLFKEPLIVAFPERHPLSSQAQVPMEALVNEHFILFPRQQGVGLYDQIISLCQSAGFSPQIMQEAIQMQTILGLVAAGPGIALVPASTQHLRSTGLVYRELQTSTVHVEMAMAWRKDATSPVLRTFLHTVREIIHKA